MIDVYSSILDISVSKKCRIESQKLKICDKNKTKEWRGVCMTKKIIKNLIFVMLFSICLAGCESKQKEEDTETGSFLLTEETQEQYIYQEKQTEEESICLEEQTEQLLEELVVVEDDVLVCINLTKSRKSFTSN